MTRDGMITSDDIIGTSRDATRAQWGVAAVVMAGSAVAGGFGFYDLTGNPWTIVNGVITALAVDWAMVSWLRISPRLRAVGAHSGWGRALEAAIVAMTMYINVGAALFPMLRPGSPAALTCLSVAHGFTPIVLLLVTLAVGQAEGALRKHQRSVAEQELSACAAAQAQERADADHRARQQQEARRDEVRAQELAVAAAEADLARQREAHDHETGQLVVSLAGLLSLAVPRVSPAVPQRPRRVPSSVPRSVPRDESSRSTSPTPRARAHDPERDLLAEARKFRATRARLNLRFNRDALRQHLNISERVAKELIRQLNAEPALRAVGES